MSSPYNQPSSSRSLAVGAAAALVITSLASLIVDHLWVGSYGMAADIVATVAAFVSAILIIVRGRPGSAGRGAAFILLALAISKPVGVATMTLLDHGFRVADIAIATAIVIIAVVAAVLLVVEWLREAHTYNKISVWTVVSLGLVVVNIGWTVAFTQSFLRHYYGNAGLGVTVVLALVELLAAVGAFLLARPWGMVGLATAFSFVATATVVSSRLGHSFDYLRSWHDVVSLVLLIAAVAFALVGAALSQSAIATERTDR